MALSIDALRVVHYIHQTGQLDTPVSVPEDVCPHNYIWEVRGELIEAGLTFDPDENVESGQILLLSKRRRQVAQLAASYRREEIQWQVLQGVSNKPNWGATVDYTEDLTICGEPVTDSEAELAVSSLHALGFIKSNIPISRGHYSHPEITILGLQALEDGYSPGQFLDLRQPGGSGAHISGGQYNVNISGGNLGAPATDSGSSATGSVDNRNNSTIFHDSVRELRQLIRESPIEPEDGCRLLTRLDDVVEDAKDKPSAASRPLRRLGNDISERLSGRLADETVARMLSLVASIGTSLGIN